LEAGFEKKEYSLPQTGTVIVGKDPFEGTDYSDLVEMRTIGISNRESSFDMIAVATYSGSKDPIVGIFIRNGSATGITLRNGTYYLYIHRGQNWNPITKKFERAPTFYRWSHEFLFPPLTYGNNIRSVQISTENMDTTWGLRISENDFPPLIAPYSMIKPKENQLNQGSN
jgi:hypothetical protein